MQEEAQTAAQLSGIVSKETQLSVLSIVPDAKAELERLEEEQADSVDLYGGMKLEGDDTAVHRDDQTEGASGYVEE